MDVLDEFDINIIKELEKMVAWHTRQLLRH
jgi:hypothetical protein